MPLANWDCIAWKQISSRTTSHLWRWPRLAAFPERDIHHGTSRSEVDGETMNAGPSLQGRHATCLRPERWRRSDLARCAIALVFAMGLASCDRRPDDRPIAYRGEYHYDKDSAYLV